MGLQSWVSVAAMTGDTTFGIRNDETLWSWGAGTYLGLTNVSISRSTPTQIGQNLFSNISVGNQQVATARKDGIRFVWGINTSGQLGIGNLLNRSSPTQVGTLESYVKSSTSIPLSPTQIGSDDWIKVSAGQSYSMAVRSDNALYVWGLNSSAEVRGSPTQIGYSATTISAGITNFGFTTTNMKEV
jgi:alpha-tubulin suppressor-like RCC1 family protein